MNNSRVTTWIALMEEEEGGVGIHPRAKSIHL